MGWPMILRLHMVSSETLGWPSPKWTHSWLATGATSALLSTGLPGLSHSTGSGSQECSKQWGETLQISWIPTLKLHSIISTTFHWSREVMRPKKKYAPLLGGMSNKKNLKLSLIPCSHQSLKMVPLLQQRPNIIWSKAHNALCWQC